MQVCLDIGFGWEGFGTQKCSVQSRAESVEAVWCGFCLWLSDHGMMSENKTSDIVQENKLIDREPVTSSFICPGSSV